MTTEKGKHVRYYRQGVNLANDPITMKDVREDSKPSKKKGDHDAE